MAEKKTEGETPQPSPAETSAGRPAGKKMSKMEAVRRSLAKLGRDAKPSEMQVDIRKRFGIDMTTDHISTYKGDIARKERAEQEAKSAGSPAEGARSAVATLGRPAGSRNGGTAAIPLEDILAIKALVRRVGAVPLRTLIDAFEK